MKTAAKIRSAAPAAEGELKTFIAKCEPKHQTLIRSVRKTLRRRFP